MNDISINDPIIFGLVAGVISYLIIHLDAEFENKKNNVNISNKCKCPLLKPSIKLPLLISVIVWYCAHYYSNLGNNTSSDVFVDTEMSMFEDNLTFTDLAVFSNV